MSLSSILTRLNRRDLPLVPKFTAKSKFALALFIAISLTFFSIGSYAQTNLLKDKQDAIKEGGNQEAWLDESLTSNMVSLQKLISGYIPDDVLNGKTTSFVPGGALGTTSNLIGAAFTPAASGTEYLAQMGREALGKPAYAQGVGFVGLQPILPLWRGFRNVVYILSSFVFIIIGIMIMLRVKVSPQAVINVQNAIPQLVTTLILVTFSYAIAGLFIDFIMLFQSFVITVLFSALGKNLNDSLFTPNALSQLLNQLGYSQNAFSFADLTTRNGFLQTWSLVNNILPAATIALVSAVIGALVGGFFSIGGGPIAIIGGAFTASVITSLIVLLIVEIVVLVNLISLLFGLIKAYVSIILKIIVAPLEIGIGAFPNSKIGFSTWATDLIANLSIFPIVLLYLVILNLIVQGINGGLWTPSLLGTIGGPFTNSLIGSLVGLGGFFIVAKLPDMIPQFIYQIKPSPWGQAIGQGFNGLSPMSIGGSIAEKIKTYDTLTGRHATTDITRISDNLLDRLNNNANAQGTPPQPNQRANRPRQIFGQRRVNIHGRGQNNNQNP